MRGNPFHGWLGNWRISVVTLCSRHKVCHLSGIARMPGSGCGGRPYESPTSGCACLSRCPISGFNGPDTVFKRSFQNLSANCPEHEAEQASLEIFAFAYDSHINVCRPVGPASKRVAMTGRASPYIGVGGRENNVVGIRPVVVQLFPNPARTLCHVRLRGVTPMHCEIFVGAVAK